MTQKHHKIFVLLLVLFYIRFFGATFINQTIINSLEFFFAGGVILISIPHVLPNRTAFVLPVQLMVLSILFSIVMAYVSWDQGIKASLIATLPQLVWILFFYLQHLRFPVKTLERIILGFGVAYIVLYFFQLLNTDYIFFGTPVGGGDEWTLNRGVIRIVFPGGGIFFLAVFIAITKLTRAGKGNWFWFVLTAFGIIIPILQVTRQFIAGICIIYAFHFLRGQSLQRKILALSALGVFTFLIIASDHPAIQGLKQMQQQEMSGEGTGNIRIKAGEYFLTKFSPNGMSQLLGNGVPYLDFSSYGKHMRKLNQLGFYFEDLGLISIYAMYGILAVVAYLIIWIKSITIPLPKKYYYVKYYLWFLFICGLTSDSLYSPYFLITTVCSLYIYQIVVQEKKRNDHGKKVKISRFIDGQQTIRTNFLKAINPSSQ